MKLQPKLKTLIPTFKPARLLGIFLWIYLSRQVRIQHSQYISIGNSNGTIGKTRI